MEACSESSMILDISPKPLLEVMSTPLCLAFPVLRQVDSWPLGGSLPQP